MTTARRRTGLLATLALTTGLLVTVTGAESAQAADAVAGGQTASPADSLFPNQGNSGYDVSHYDVDFRIDVGIGATHNAPSTTTLQDATATIDATTTAGPLSSYSFDFQGTSTTLEASTLNVDSVTVNGAPATFTRIENTTIPDATTDKHKLVVTPATPVSGAFTTVVTYSGQPVSHRDTDNSIEGWNNTVDGATFVNQPVGSMTLFPNNNTPRDTATYTWTVDAPSKLGTSNIAVGGDRTYQAAVVSNGELVSRTPSGDGTRTTWVWDQQEPQASELSFFSIGRYDIYTSDIALSEGRTIPEWTFIDPALSQANKATTLSTRAQIGAALTFFESKYGAYPGNSTGLVVDNTTGINYALETQDRPFFPNSASRATTYHELMHQWWGNAVAPTDWNDISLNEGPAQYSEFQFPYEGAGSTTTTTEQANFALYTSRSATSDTFAVPPAALTEAGELFGDQSYERGSLALEALRTSIGAADFETLMREYQVTYGGTQIPGRRIAAFEALAEDISGRDLGEFFQTWYFTAGKPAWPVKFNLNLAGPTGPVDSGDPVTYTLSARNTGKVAMPAGGTVVKVDLAGVLDDATIGPLPSGTTLDGSTLTWTVPATALAATASIDIQATTEAGTMGSTLDAVARADTLGGTCVDCAPRLTIGTATTSPAPVPAITGGPATVGTPLTADATGWAEGTTFSYQWLVDGTPLPDATTASYTPTASTVGLPVRVRVTGTSAGLNPASVTSAATANVARGTLTTATPTITGAPQAGQPLTVSPGAWTPGTVFTYAWRNGGTAINGATGTTYYPTAGQVVSVVVTGTRAGYTTATATSAATDAVAAGPALEQTPAPVLDGTPKVGAPFEPTLGTWDTGTVLTFQWAANGTNIASNQGGTGATLTPTAAQLGRTLTLTVTGTKPGLTPVSRTTAVASAPVEVGTQVLQPTPTISGTPRAQSPSTGVPGTWDANTTRTYQWYADGVAIAGATATTYQPLLSQIGQALTFEVTSTRAGYTTVTKTSAPKTVLGLQQAEAPTPTISGTPKVDAPLTADPGTWDEGTTLAYQWSADGEPVTGATELVYTPGVAQLGARITVTVTSSKPDHETVSRTSEPTEAIGDGDLVSTPSPTITGTPKVGVELTAVPGAWDEGTTFGYQWSADGVAVDGATGATYTPGPSRLGEIITVAVTGSRTGYTSVTKSSDPTAPVAAGDLGSSPKPTIAGTPKVGVELDAAPGAWDEGTTFTYQWSADGQTVEGATGATYTPGPGRLGDVITVAVTGTRTGYTPVTRTSDSTAPVAAGDLAVAPTPVVTGTPKVGVELTAVPGTWDEGVTLTYQWRAGETLIEGADSASFTPGPGLAGERLTVTVRGTKDGYEPVSRTSEPAAPVALGDLTTTPEPTITGIAQVGRTVSAASAPWDSDTVLTYQWQRNGVAIAGRTAATYAVVAADRGTRLSVVVTGTKPGYAPVSRVSPAPLVAAGTQTRAPKPRITGTPQVGRTLRVAPAAYDAGVRLTYRWLVGGKVVAGGKAKTFRLTKKHVGKRVTVRVTATKVGYVTRTATSAATRAVRR
ncbi:M1 family aminopeptidase [Nocardioides sp. 503]|uniref:M1 family aminopeptidase n=1 Tax=Nocardioides sp. 503 TaxID=2508326 RepID=UPI00106F7D69|nr:M1 family aminopeptidase [Nocardioides sp. 503]